MRIYVGRDRNSYTVDDVHKTFTHMRHTHQSNHQIIRNPERRLKYRTIKSYGISVNRVEINVITEFGRVMVANGCSECAGRGRGGKESRVTDRETWFCACELCAFGIPCALSRMRYKNE